MFGAAIGDAMGAAFEFVSSAAIEKHLGGSVVRGFEPAMRGSLLYPRAAGRPTDDTAMALSVARVIISQQEPTADAFAHRFLEDLERGSGVGPGSATLRGLASLREGCDPATNGAPSDGGNGAAMRVHPIGFLESREAVLRAAALQARITHGHPAAIAAAQAVAVLVYDAVAGVPPSRDVPSGIDDAEFIAAWHPKGETRTAQNPCITALRKLTRRRLGSPIRRQRRGIAHFDRIVGDVNEMRRGRPAHSRARCARAVPAAPTPCWMHSTRRRPLCCSSAVRRVQTRIP